MKKISNNKPRTPPIIPQNAGDPTKSLGLGVGVGVRVGVRVGLGVMKYPVHPVHPVQPMNPEFAPVRPFH